MYLTQTNVVRGLKKKEYKLLGEMCKYSNNLSNVALYNIRQYFFKEKKFFQYESNYHECKNNENYKMLQAGVSQQILKVVDRNFKSFFNLLKKARKGEYRMHDVKMPYYREKGGMFVLVMSQNAIAIKDGYFRMPLSRDFAKKYDVKEMKIRFPERLEHKKIKEVRILPMQNGKFFKIQYCYEEAEENLELNKDNKLGIDVGLNNLATCVPTNGTPFIMDGRRIKSINCYWNKRKAKLQSEAEKNHKKTTKLIGCITRKRNNRCNDILKKTARYIINYCIRNNIGTIVIGYNKGMTKNINIGKKKNQQFTEISFGSLRCNIATLCERYGIDYVEQEESYTSKASFLDGDTIPTYGTENDKRYEFSGRRIKRGLYKTKDGILLNADVNGALNILRKSKQNFCKERLCKGCLAHPLRIRLA